MGARVRVPRACFLPVVLSTALSLIAGPAARAQTLPAAPSSSPGRPGPQVRPVTGFVSSYEIVRAARADGFTPLAPPLRNGTIYVMRATDFRGVLMRVVFDARTGAVRDATRIVPADSESYGMMQPYYGPPPPYAPPPYEPPSSALLPYGPPPYDEPDGYGALPPDSAVSRPPTQLAAPQPPPKMMRPAAPAHTMVPPLPRARPAVVAAQKSQKTLPLSAARPPVVAPAQGSPTSKTPPTVPLND